MKPGAISSDASNRAAIVLDVEALWRRGCMSRSVASALSELLRLRSTGQIEFQQTELPDGTFISWVSGVLFTYAFVHGTLTVKYASLRHDFLGSNS